MYNVHITKTFSTNNVLFCSQRMRETFVFGVTLWATVGPMTMLIISRSCSWGYVRGLATGLGVGTADLTYAIIAFSIGGLLVRYLEPNMFIFRTISASVLLIFGIYMLRESMLMKNQTLTKEPLHFKKKRQGLIKDFFSAYGLTMINPLTIIIFRWFSWQTISISTTFSSIIILSFLLFFGTLSVQLSVALLAGRIRNKINDTRILMKINVCASIAIILFAIKWFLWR